MNTESFSKLSLILLFDREALMTVDTIVAVTEATGHIEIETIIVTGHVCVCVVCVCEMCVCLFLCCGR